MNLTKCKKCNGCGYTNQSKLGRTYDFSLYECSICEGKGAIYITPEPKNLDDFVVDTFVNTLEPSFNQSTELTDETKKKKRGRPSV